MTQIGNWSVAVRQRTGFSFWGLWARIRPDVQPGAWAGNGFSGPVDDFSRDDTGGCAVGKVEPHGATNWFIGGHISRIMEDLSC